MKNEYAGYLPDTHKYLWWFVRIGLMAWGIYGIFHGSVVEFLQAVFAVQFTHLWDYFQIFGGRSFITRVDYRTQTMLNVFIFVGVTVGSTLNNRTEFRDFDVLTHFFSGFLAAWFGYELAMLMEGKKYTRLSPALAALFSFCFALGIAVGWEIYEFTMDRLYGLSLQNSAPTTDAGLTDTMWDFIVSAAGGLVGMFVVAFCKNRAVGRSVKEIKEKIRREDERELLKEKLLEDYLKVRGGTFDENPGGF